MTSPRNNKLLRIFEEALARPKGVVVSVPDEASAKKLRFTLYKLRNRAKEKKLQGADEFDILDIKIQKTVVPNSPEDEAAGLCPRVKIEVLIVPGQLRFSDLKVTDAETGENISGGFETSDEVKSLED